MRGDVGRAGQARVRENVEQEADRMVRPFGLPYEPDLTRDIADAIQTYWIQGLDDGEMAEWLSTQDAAETATAMASAINDAISARYSVQRRPPHGIGPL